MSRSTWRSPGPSSSVPPMTAASVVFWMIPTSRLTSGGSSRRSACGRITKACRPTQPKPSADAASCCSRGIDCTAPRVASATCALPQSVSADRAGGDRVELERSAERRRDEVDHEDRDDDRQPAPDLDVEADQRARRQEVDRQQRAEHDADERARRSTAIAAILSVFGQPLLEDVVRDRARPSRGAPASSAPPAAPGGSRAGGWPTTATRRARGRRRRAR